MRACQAAIDSREFVEWMALDKLDPLPDPWLMHGILCATLVNCHLPKGAARAKPDDFIPRDAPPATPGDLERQLRAAFVQAGVKFIEK